MNGKSIGYDNQRLSLKPIQPLTKNQHKTFDAWYDDKNLLLHGYAGTGKTFISLYLALKELFELDTGYNKIYILRSAVATRNLGFMPGDLSEKIEVFEAPYVSICTELTGRSDAYETFKKSGILDFVSTSYIRGITLHDCILVVDEIQNMDWGELSSVITRMGENCSIIFCGDFRQSDFRGRQKESRKDVMNFMKVLENMIDDFTMIEFGVDDIVRNKMVKNFLVTSDKLGYTL